MVDGEKAPADVTRRVAGWICAAVGAGLLFGLALFWLYWAACSGRTGGVCKMVVDSPPWLVLTSVIAAPAVLLTWHWRTVHKEADIRKGEADLVHGARVLAADQRKVADEQRLANEAHRTERFARAVELLGSERPAIRLGGIYSLERLTKDSPTDRSTIIETLAGFVRMESAHDPREIDPESQECVPDWDLLGTPGEDVRAAVAVLGRRNDSQTDPVVDLSQTNLRKVVMRGASFSKAEFLRAFLVEADCHKADFRSARFIDSCLRRTWLAGARLTNAVMHRADLTQANLCEADLTNAILDHADLERAHLARADLTGANLTAARLVAANLTSAKLINANLTGANLSGANLNDADLTGADLTDANLTAARLGGANLTSTKLERTEVRDAVLTGTNVSNLALATATRGGVLISLSDDEFNAALKGERKV